MLKTPRFAIAVGMGAAALLTVVGGVQTAAAQTLTGSMDQAAFVTVSAAVAPAAQPASVSRENAKEMALSYLDYSAFSRSGLIEQLVYEGFSKADATYGADATRANWYRQAARMAADYLDYQAFSRRGLIAQLKYEGFSTAQATYGAKSVGL